MKLQQKRTNKFLTIAMALCMFLCILPAQRVDAATKKGVDFKEENLVGTSYLPENLMVEILSYYGANSANPANDIKVFDKNTKIKVSISNGTWKAKDTSITLWGLDVVQDASGNYKLDTFNRLVDSEYSYNGIWKVNKSYKFPVKKDCPYVVTQTFGGATYQMFDISEKIQPNGTNYLYDLYVVQAYNTKKKQSYFEIYAPDGSNAIEYITSELAYNFQPMESKKWGTYYEEKYVSERGKLKKQQTVQLNVKAKGQVTYQIAEASYDWGKIDDKTVKKYIKLDENGKVTVKKGTPCGYYTILVTAEGTDEYSKRYAWYTIGVVYE